MLEIFLSITVMMCLDIGRGRTLPSYYFSTWIACKSHCFAISFFPPFFAWEIKTFSFHTSVEFRLQIVSIISYKYNLY